MVRQVDKRGGAAGGPGRGGMRLAAAQPSLLGRPLWDVRMLAQGRPAARCSLQSAALHLSAPACLASSRLCPPSLLPRLPSPVARSAALGQQVPQEPSTFQNGRSSQQALPPRPQPTCTSTVPPFFSLPRAAATSCRNLSADPAKPATLYSACARQGPGHTKRPARRQGSVGTREQGAHLLAQEKK